MKHRALQNAPFACMDVLRMYISRALSLEVVDQ